MSAPWCWVPMQAVLGFGFALIGTCVGNWLVQERIRKTAYARGRIDAFKAVYQWHGRLAAAAQLGPAALRDEMARLQAQFSPNEKDPP